MFEDIDFSKLSLQDALDLAICIEEEARDRYREFAVQMAEHHTPEAAEFFQFMAGNEEKHRDELSQRRTGLFGDAPARVDRSMIWDVEAPEHDQPRVFMSAREALQIALESELKARDYFASALQHINDPDVIELFDELRREEVEHQQMVQQQLQKLPAEADFDPDDFVDPAQGH